MYFTDGNPDLLNILTVNVTICTSPVENRGKTVSIFKTKTQHNFFSHGTSAYSLHRDWSKP